MKYILPLILAVILLSACSPGELFSQLAKSDIEQGAQEAIEQQQKQNQKLELIEAKKKSFPQMTLLTVQNEDDAYQAIAFRNNYSVDEKSILDIEAILPDPETNTHYYVWIKNLQEKTCALIGNLSQRDVDDYIFTYETDEDITNQSQVIISMDEEGATQPENIILSGAFSSQQ